MKATLWFILGVVHSVALDKYMMTCNLSIGCCMDCFHCSKNPLFFSIIFSIN